MMRPQRACNQPHGTVARYVAGCSCLPCCNAWRDYQVEWKADTARLVDAAPVAEHIKVLIYNGWRTRGIAEQAGVSYNTVRYCRTGRRPTIHRDSAAAIMSLPLQTPIPTDSSALVPARSTLRLIARLNKHHSMEAIAREVGVSRKALPQQGQHSVQARTAKRVKDAAARLRAAS
ncbi:MAG: hypothetical protein ACYCXZ_06670 [Coriobacteriia bacterium]